MTTNAATNSLIVLIDRSESMRGERFFGCLRGCADTMAAMAATTAQSSTAQCTILTFNEAMDRVYDGPVCSESQQALHGIAGMACEGKTRYFDVMTSLIRQRLKRPEPAARVTFVVATDGLDTASTLCTADTLKLAVEEARQHHAWEFKYVGIAHDPMGAGALQEQALATGFLAADTYCTDSVMDVPRLVREASGRAEPHKPLRAAVAPHEGGKIAMPQLARTHTIR